MHLIGYLTADNGKNRYGFCPFMKWVFSLLKNGDANAPLHEASTLAYQAISLS